MDKLTFKQYLDSRSQLLEAVNRPPKSKIVYQIKKYCTLKLYEGDTGLGLKPGNQLTVEWDYANPQSPTPLNATFNGKNVQVAITTAKFTKWLLSNCSKGEHFSHLI